MMRRETELGGLDDRRTLVAPHGEATWFTPVPRSLLPKRSLGLYGGVEPGASKIIISKAARAGASSGSQPLQDSRAPRSSRRVSCSPGGAAEQLGPRTGAGRCISARPRRVYRDVERGLQETVWQAGPRQMDCQLISMYL